MQTAVDQLVIPKLEKPQLPLSQLLLVLLIAGAGFLIDVYDIAIFSVVRIPSLKALAVPQAQIFSTGIILLNLQLLGMIIGAFVWGVIGDKSGRKSALFGSIFLYSLTTLASGFVSSIPIYAIARFLAGIGLAGEVGTAITIAAEITPPKYRSFATGAIRGFGLCGAVLAALAGDHLSWRMAYIIAGIAGFLLLFVRMSVKETEIFTGILGDKQIKRGSLKILFLDKDRFIRLLRCVLAAVPYWFVVSIIISFAPEICAHAGKEAIVVTVASVIFFETFGRIAGEMGSAILSHFLRSRKLAAFIGLIGFAICTMAILSSPPKFYVLLAVPLGLFIGYYSVILTSTAEQFGTNLRSTATTIAANFVRASAIIITLLFSMLTAHLSMAHSALIVAAVCFIAAFISIAFMEETFARDLNFIERSKA